MQVWSLDWEDPLEEGMAPHSSILAWRIPRTEEPGGLQATGLQSWTQLSNFHSVSYQGKTRASLGLCLLTPGNQIGANSYLVHLMTEKWWGDGQESSLETAKGYRSGSLNLNTADSEGQSTLSWGLSWDIKQHLNFLPTPTPVITTKNVSRHLPGGQDHPWLRIPRLW